MSRKIIEVLRQKNRTVLEMHMGILFVGMVCQIIGVCFVKNQALYAGSLWFGIVMAMVSTLHMYRTLDRALSLEEKMATKAVYKGYMIRYVLIAVIMLIIMVTGVMNPLIVFMGYMSLKVTALMQPITHKLCNKLFHETDPIPQALPEEEQQLNEE